MIKLDVEVPHVRLQEPRGYTGAVEHLMSSQHVPDTVLSTSQEPS